MSSSDRGEFYTFGLVVIVAACFVLVGTGSVFWLAKQKLDYNQERNYRPENYAAQPSYICFKLPPLVSVCPQEQGGPRAEAHRSDDDLKAQQEMADWAFIVAVFSALGFILSAAGVALIYATFRATRHANNIAKKAMFIQSRPWVSVENFTITSLRVIEIDGNWDLWANWEYDLCNTGATASLSFQNVDYVFTHFGYRDEIIRAEGELLVGLIRDGGRAIAPNSKFHNEGSRVVPIQRPPEGTAHTIELNVVVVVTYMSALSDEKFQTTQAFWVGEWPSGPGSRTVLDFKKIQEGRAEPVVERIGRSRMS